MIYHIIKRAHFYLYDYKEEYIAEGQCHTYAGIQSEPTWRFNWLDCLFFTKEYGLQVAENVKGTLYEIEYPNEENYQPKIGIMIRSFENERNVR